MSPVPPLPPEALRRACDPAAFPFETTAALEPVSEAPGQERALEALAFGLGMRRDGYHLFAMGPVETGKAGFVTTLIRKRAANEPKAKDLCYLHNFDEPWKPRALVLPPGRASALKKDLERLVEDLHATIPAALEGEEQRARKQVIEEEMKERHEHAFEDLRREALESGISVVRTPLGFAFAPVKGGEVMPPEEFEALPEEERKRIVSQIEALQERLRKIVEQVQSWAHEAREKMRALIRDLTKSAVRRPIDAMRARWEGEAGVLAHLDAVQADVVGNVADFVHGDEAPLAPGGLPMVGPTAVPPPFRRYMVNVLVDHGDEAGAPVVTVDDPNFGNLVGRVEHLPQMGTLVTDFLLVKAGALHRANGGYLILDARRVLLQPLAYEALKRALHAGKARVESPGQMLSLVSTVTLEPEAFDLDVKVVLIGDRSLHHLLHALDPEFHPLFKVAVDFDEQFPRTPENDLLTARWIGTIARAEECLAFERGAVARVVEQSARLVADGERLSTHRGSLKDLLRQSDHWAREAGREAVSADDVETALAAEERRMGRVKERLLEETIRGTLRIDTDGERVGEVNGLAVLQSGHFAFGRPSRISCRVRLGRGEVVDVEREVDLGGPLHSKGVLILSGFLSARYAPDHPLSVSATLTFEQSYGMVDGDSASSTELYALLSALASAPIRQGIAVTGSVDQHGNVQPIGGVNEKVEGFFDLCAQRGLTGRQGCLIPRTNAKHLMLDRKVVTAAREGRFHVWPVSTIDEGIELLTGIPAGERGPDGLFPAGSVNRRVEDRLVSFAKRRIELGLSAEGRKGRGERGGGGNDKEGGP